MSKKNKPRNLKFGVIKKKRRLKEEDYKELNSKELKMN